MGVYLGTSNKTLTNLISNGSLASSTTGWTISSTGYTATQGSGYLQLESKGGASPGTFYGNYQDFTEISGSTNETKKILYLQMTVCGKPSNKSGNVPTGFIRTYKNGSTSSYNTGMAAITTPPDPVCTFSSIGMSTLPSGGYAYATINSDTTHYTTGSIPITYGDIVHIYMERTSGNSGVYLYHDKSTPDEMPDYHEYSSALTYNWDTSTVPYNFNNATIVFENDDTGYLNCTIKIDQAWQVKSTVLLPTYDGTDYYSYNRVQFAILSTDNAGDICFFKKIILVNLTAEFGAGNEPTKAECDANIYMTDSGTVIYSGAASIAGTASAIKRMYIGIDGIARKVKKGYIGIGGVAQEFYHEPTLRDFFESLDSFDRWGQSASTAAVSPGSTSSTWPEPDSSMVAGAEGQTWYLFYTVGPSIEISRVDLISSTTLTKTTLRTVTTGTQYTSVVNTNSTGIYCTTSTNAGTYVYMHSTMSPAIIDELFQNASITIVKGYHSSSTTSTTANVGVATSTTYSEGLLYGAFSNMSGTGTSATKTTRWGAIDATTPAGNVIKGGTNATWLTSTPLLISSSGYYMPSYNGTAKVQYVRGYTLVYFN